MTTVLIDDDWTGQTLASATSRLEIRSRAGALLGYFLPAMDPTLYQELRSPHSDEELDRRAREGGGRPLADILRDFEKLQ